MLEPGVLVARTDNCGDVLLAGPAVRAVAQTGRRVVFLCGPRGRAAAELLLGVDHLIEWRAPWIEPAAMPVRRADANQLIDQVRQQNVADAVILVSSHQSPLPLALLLRWAGVERIAAVSHEHAGSLLDIRIAGDPDLHEVERNLLVAEALGFPPPADDHLAVQVPPASSPPPPGPYVVVHPGATAPARTLPVPRWASAVEALAADGWTVLVTGGPNEQALTATVADRGDPSVVDLGGRTSFGELARLIAGAAAFVGGNTGPLHLAAAVGTPVAAVFPPTVPLLRWHPWKVPHTVLGHQEVSCAGCRSLVCPLPEQLCIEGIDATQIANAVDALTKRDDRIHTQRGRSTHEVMT